MYREDGNHKKFIVIELSSPREKGKYLINLRFFGSPKLSEIHRLSDMSIVGFQHTNFNWAASSPGDEGQILWCFSEAMEDHNFRRANHHQSSIKVSFPIAV